MRDSRVPLILFIVASVVQFAAMKNVYGSDMPGLPFATAYEPETNITVLITRVFCLYIPIPFMLFVVSGTVRELSGGYSRLILIRGCSREQLFRKKMLKTVLMVTGMVLFMTALHTAAGNHRYHVTPGQAADIILIYWLVIIDLVMLGYMMEFLTGLSGNTVNIAANVYFVASLLAPGISHSSIAGYAFFPGMAFAKANDIYDGTGGDVHILQLSMLAGAVLMCWICIRRYRQADIL